MTKVISFINHKGGTGKTTSVINIGSALAKKGYKTLLVDLDSQANLSEGLGVFDAEQTLYTTFKNKSVIPEHFIAENLYLCPSNLDLVGFEFDVARQDYKESVLKKLLSKVIEKYDYVLFDLPPTLSTLVFNALVISKYVCIPMQVEFFAYRGLDRIMEVIKTVKENSNPDIELLGVFLTQFNNSRTITNMIKDAVNNNFEGKLFKTKIRVNVKLVEAQAQGESIFDYDESSAGAKDYEDLTNEILTSLN